MTGSRFRTYSAIVVVAVLGVILWGAYVRATGSGAGCGSHWPTCNGEVIPRAPSAATVIEFTHRVTSGLSFFMVVGQLVWALRAFPRRHLARRAAGASMFFMVTEALVGAGLVVFEMVAGNASVARGAWMIAHLGNTFALVASLTVTWWAAGPRPRPAASAGPRALGALLGLGLAGVLVVGASGAIAALGDTLFPVQSLAQGWQEDLSPAAHLFVRLRVLHPIFAVGVGLYLLALTGLLASRDEPRGSRGLATLVAAGVLLQIGAGLLNLALLAPTWLQLVHLLLADLVWIALVLLTAHAVAARAPAAAPVAALGAGAGASRG